MGNLKEYFTSAVAVVTFFGIFFEITPIKINPITKILKYCGDKMNEDLRKDITSMKEDVKRIDDKVDENEIDRIRYEILSFASSCRNKRKHSRENFLHIIELNTKYHKIIEEKGLENGQIDIEFELIKNIYKKCSENNSFLCDSGCDE